MLLKAADRRTLLAIARQSIANALSGKASTIQRDDYRITDLLEINAGAFVTLEKNHRLRGCVGYVEGNGTLFETVSDAAVAAALGDSRFPVVTQEELPHLTIEISVLSPLVRVTDTNKIEAGRHGLLIRSGYHHGLLLPQVATEHQWSRETFLEQTCLKAGLQKDAWEWKNTQLFCFTAVVFSEADFMQA